MAKRCVDCFWKKAIEGKDRCQTCQEIYERAVAKRPPLQEINFPMVCIGGLPKISHPEIQKIEQFAESRNMIPRLPCVAHIIDDGIKIEVFTFKNELVASYTIPENRIIDIDFITQKNIEEKQKSIVGRGIVGGLLFGSTGAIIGGLSGLDTKTATTYTTIFCITYQKKDGGVANLLFDPTAIVSDQNGYDCQVFRDTYYKKFPPVHKQIAATEVIEEVL